MLMSWQMGLLKTDEINLANVLFLYDPATNKDLVTGMTCGVLRANTTVDATRLIDGQSTLKDSTSSSGATITFPTPLNLDAMPEWTIEWSSYSTSIPYDYATELLLNWAAGPLIGARWTDAGFGYRLQFSGGGFGQVASIWRVSATNSTSINKVNKYAMVFKDNKICVFKDGVKQTMNNGTSNTVAQDYFTKNGAWGPLTTMIMGWASGTVVSWIGNYGRVRISSAARYLTNYTPQPF